MKPNVTAGLILSLTIASAHVLAAGSSSSSTRTVPAGDYQRAVAAAKAGAYQRALALIEKVLASDPRNADAWNYKGFSHRNLGQYDDALDAYNRALAIDSKHRGAREYLGELYLMKGDLAAAEEQLRELDSICYFGCEEYDELKAAIEKHKQG